MLCRLHLVDLLLQMMKACVDFGKLGIAFCNFGFCLFALFVVFGFRRRKFRLMARFENFPALGFLLFKHFFLGGVYADGFSRRRSRHGCGRRSLGLGARSFFALSHFRFPAGAFDFVSRMRFYALGFLLSHFRFHLSFDKRGAVLLRNLLCAGAGNFRVGAQSFNLSLRARPFAFQFGLRLCAGAGCFGTYKFFVALGIFDYDRLIAITGFCGTRSYMLDMLDAFNAFCLFRLGLTRLFRTLGRYFALRPQLLFLLRIACRND